MCLRKMVIAVSLLIMAVLAFLVLTGFTSSRNTANSVSILLQKEVALREVEVSTWETANAVFYYLRDPSEISKQEYLKQLQDVGNYLASSAIA